MAALPPDVLHDLKTRQLTFLKARLVSDKARIEWRKNLEALWEGLRERKVSEVVSAETVARVLDGPLLANATQKLAHPLAESMHRLVARELAKDSAPIGTYLPETSREALSQLLRKRHPIVKRLFREALEHESVQEGVRDVLYDALVQFNTTVNPFFAEWGIPSLVRRVMPLGAGAVLKSLELVRTEFDKRLEPEIRKFLQTFSKKALRKVADSGSGSGSMAPREGGASNPPALQKALLEALYGQEVRTLVTDDEAERISLIHRLWADAFVHSVGLETLTARRDEWIAEFFKMHGDSTVDALLKELGITFVPDFDVLADVTFPPLALALSSEPVTQWIETLVSEFFDAEMAP